MQGVSPWDPGYILQLKFPSLIAVYSRATGFEAERAEEIKN